VTIEQERVLHSGRGIHETEPGVFEVTSDAPSHGGMARAWYRVKRFLLGPSLSSKRERSERLGWTVALAILGADAIASFAWRLKWMLLFRRDTVVTSVPQTIHE
jgi:hypothetical protein